MLSSSEGLGYFRMNHITQTQTIRLTPNTPTSPDKVFFGSSMAPKNRGAQGGVLDQKRRHDPSKPKRKKRRNPGCSIWSVVQHVQQASKKPKTSRHVIGCFFSSLHFPQHVYPHILMSATQAGVQQEAPPPPWRRPQVVPPRPQALLGLEKAFNF